MFNEYFSDERIINQICKERVNLAGHRHDRQYIGRLAGHVTENAPLHTYYQIMPPRRTWSAFRPRYRPDSSNPDLLALKNAVRILRQQQPETHWVVALNQYIREIRERVLNPDFTITPPTITWLLKKRGGHEYRALCKFSPDDNLILCLFAQYLRDEVDGQFSEASYAFRAPRNGRTKTHHDAFTEIYNLKHNSPNCNLYVAECDIRGFFDTVDHGVALKRFQEAALQSNMDPRAELIFQAYLDCYSFPVNVLAQAEPRLRRSDSEGYFKWPKTELAKLHHTDPHGLRIGVPQGGAVSGIIANLIMDAVDKRVEEEKARLGVEIHYYRYCDDMILITPTLKQCQQVFDVYLKKLTELKLAFHHPERTVVYERSHWENKSKAPYCWSGQHWFGCVPWVQFVGYQIRYDGLVRPRKESVAKQNLKLVETTNEMKFGLAELEGVRATRSQALSSLKARLVAKGVGRVKGGEAKPLPMCWASGYRSMHNKPFVDHALRSFDQTRQKQIFRFARTVIAFGQGNRPRSHATRMNLGGYRSSYHSQFNNQGGLNLIQHPWRPANLKDRVKSWWFEQWKRWFMKADTKSGP
jgi:hypothetical protein